MDSLFIWCQKFKDYVQASETYGQSVTKMSEGQPSTSNEQPQALKVEEPPLYELVSDDEEEPPTLVGGFE